MQRSDFELMAPAGSREALAAAIDAKADAVYFGVGELNMRALASSAFSVNDLAQIADICRAAGVKSYLTVNTVIFDEDMRSMHDIVQSAAQAGIDAVIASDVAVIEACRRAGIEVHLSTQLNIANVEALRFYAQWADVAVLARELTLEQVAHIAQAVKAENICGPSGAPIRLEMFCHGALCMAVSGKCYMSLHTRGKSANRGACLQTCRRSYVIKDAERDIELELDNGYLLSPKDLKTIGFLDKMVAAGVSVFKIEGRARGPEYVDTVVRCYKEAIQSVLDGDFTEEKKDAWDERLKRVFNRGFWDGYYQGQWLGEWTKNYGSAATEKKVYVGKVIKYFSNLSVGEFQIEASDLSVGDKLLITGPTTGAMFLDLEEVRYDLKPVQTVSKSMRVSFKVPDKIRPSDKLYKLVKVETED